MSVTQQVNQKTTDLVNDDHLSVCLSVTQDYRSVRPLWGGSVAEWLACWTQAQKGMGSNCSRDAVLGKLFTPIVPLFTKQRNW